MLTNAYLQQVYDGLAARNAEQKEFLQAVAEVLESIQPLVERHPEYEKYGRSAPLKRNVTIIENADIVLAFWDGRSKGTLSVIKYAEKVKKPCEVILCQ